MHFVFLRISWAYFRRHLLQSLLLILGVALGVAMVLAIDLANQGAERAFTLATRTLSGSVTHRLKSGAPGIPEALYARLRLQWPDYRLTPVVSGYVRLTDGRPLRLIGTDLLAGGFGRGGDLSAFSRFLPVLTGEGAVLISSELATELAGVSVLKLRAGLRTVSLPVAGILTLENDWEREGGRRLLLTDPGTAQQLLGLSGYLTSLDLVLPPGQVAAFQRQLPPGVQLEAAQREQAALETMTRSFRLNLSALSLLALLVGMFLVYNTISFSVLQRRPLLAVLRTLGVSRAEIMTLILAETIAVTLLGVILGLGMGCLMGYFALQGVLRTINDLYFTLEVGHFVVSPFSVLKGVLAGFAAAIPAAFLPAWEAAATPPAGALRRSGLEVGIERLFPRLLILGLVLLGLGVVCMSLPVQGLTLSFAGFFALVSGSALMVPALMGPLIAMLAWLLRPVGLLSAMASRNLLRARSRTAVSVAALMVAVSVVVSVSIMIGSFRLTLSDWLARTLNADLFITAATGQQVSVALPVGLPEKLRGLSGVKRVDSARHQPLNTAAYGPIRILALSRDIAADRPYVWRALPPEQIWPALERGGVLVSQPFAFHHRIEPRSGQMLELETDQGLRRFPVVGIYHDYQPGRDTLLLADAVYRRFWRDRGIDSLAVTLQPAVDLELWRVRLERMLPDDSFLQVQSHRQLRQGALQVFDRTFAITTAVRLLAVAVALMGIFSALLSFQLERTRELGLLRALGVTRQQLAGLILLESALMGLLAGLLALPLGTGLSWALIHVINLRSFGWLIEFRPAFVYYWQALEVALVAALLAGIWPAVRMSRVQPARALKYE
jgi:putative ABC transport system permease protein